MTQPLDLVFIGLSLSSAWGNGHATTFRSLLRGLNALGHRILFLECDRPWYAANRDMPQPDFCTLEYFQDARDLAARYGNTLRRADAVIIGSYVPEGVAVIEAVSDLGPKSLCFYDIDTPITLRKIEDGDEEYLARAQIPLFDAYFSFSGGASIEHLQQRYGARRAMPLYCSVDPDIYHPTRERRRWDLGYLGTYSADRQPMLEKMLIEPAQRLPQLRFVVAGSRYPDDIVWPANVERIEHIPPAMHASFYNRQRFTLNITRDDMVQAGWSPSVRLFEAAACRTPVISDSWPGLEELFPDGKAILIAETGDDVVTALTKIPDPDRRRIAATAARLVREGHTGVIRAQQLVDTLMEIAPSPGRGVPEQSNMANLDER